MKDSTDDKKNVNKDEVVEDSNKKTKKITTKTSKSSSKKSSGKHSASKKSEKTNKVSKKQEKVEEKKEEKNKVEKKDEEEKKIEKKVEENKKTENKKIEKKEEKKPEKDTKTEKIKAENIERLLKAKNIDEFYDIYFELVPQGGVELKDIDIQLVEKEKQLLKKIPKEQTVEFGKDVFKKEKVITTDDENEELEENETDKSDDKNKLIDPNTLKIDELEAIKKEIKDNKKSKRYSDENKTKYKEMLKNALIGILINLYIIFLLFGKNTIGTIEYITDLKIFIIIEAIISVILLEISFSKHNKSLIYHAVEMIGLGSSTILILDLFNRQSDKINIAFAVITSVYTLYYLIKIIVIFILKRKKNKNGNI